MLIKDIDLNELEKLLHALPDSVDCTMITFENNDINLHIIAGTKALNNVEYIRSLRNLNKVIHNYDEFTIKKLK